MTVAYDVDKAEVYLSLIVISSIVKYHRVVQSVCSKDQLKGTSLYTDTKAHRETKPGRNTAVFPSPFQSSSVQLQHFIAVGELVKTRVHQH